METLAIDLESITKGRWEWRSNSDPWSQTEEPKWELYSLEHNYLIEKAYYENKDEVDIGDYIISIKHMIQKKKGNLIKQRPIRRIDWIESVQEVNRSARYFETELPKTINKIFGSLGDFISFFSRRNPAILDFTNHFKDLEQSNDLDILNHMILPQLVNCLEEALLKPNLKQLQDSSLSAFKKKLLLKVNERTEELISLFKKKVSNVGEFYEEILKAYTMDTDLYPNLNKSLRDESWVEIDKLLPYAFCLCKAFFHFKLKTNLAQDNPIQELKTVSKTLYRGTALDEFALNFYDLKIIKDFSWNSVTSTTTSKEMAESFMYKASDLTKKKYPVMFIIEIPQTNESEAEYLKWIDIHQFSAIPKEGEVVLAPGSVFELIEVSTDQDKKTTIKIKLRNEIKSLAYGGMMMQGTLQSQMMTEKEARIMCLEEEELSQALISLCGNKLIEEIEFCLCTFDERLLRKLLFDILPTLEKSKILKFAACKYQDNEKSPIEELNKGERCQIIKIEVIEASDFFQRICNEEWNHEYWVCLRELDLDFRSIRNLTDEELDCAVSQGLRYLTHLTSLNANFERCRQITDKGVNNFASQGLKHLTQLTSLTMNFKACLSLRMDSFWSLGLKYLDQLRYLDLSYERGTNAEVKNLSSQGLKYLTQLTSLTLDLVSYDDDEMETFASDGLRHLTQLTYLNLYYNKVTKEITDKGLRILAAQGLKSLQSLTFLKLELSYLTKVTNEGVRSLAGEGLKYLVQLESLGLDFTYCPQITNEGVSNLMSEGLKNLTQLTSLNLSFHGCEEITDKEIDTLVSQHLKHLISLKPLKIEKQRILTNDIKIQQQPEENSRVRLAREKPYQSKQSETENLASIVVPILIKGQDKIHDSHSVQKISEICHLTSITLNFQFHRDSITDEFFQNFASQILKHSPQLRSLTLNCSNCTKLTDEGVRNLALNGLKYLTELESLNLDFFVCHISDKGVIDLTSEGLRHLPKLKFLALELRINYQITDKGLLHLVQHGLVYLSHLESLALNFSYYITDQGIDDLISQGLKNLSQLRSLTLAFSQCIITEKAVNNLILQIIKNLPELTIFDLCLDNCKNISDVTMINIIKVLHYFGFTKEID